MQQDGGLPDNFHGSNIYHVYLPWCMVEIADQVFDWANVAPGARNNWQVSPISGESPLNLQKNTLANQSRDSQGRVVIGGVVVNITDLIFMDEFEM